jgi:tRNA 2-thiocytidine biosynthesis protein TtcA
MLAEWDKRFPGRVENTFNALSRVAPSHLMDRHIFDFAGLRATGVADPEGDIAFDEEPCTNDFAVPDSIAVRSVLNEADPARA